MKDACQSVFLIISTERPLLHFRVTEFFSALLLVLRYWLYKYSWNLATMKYIFCLANLVSWSEDGSLQQDINTRICENKLCRSGTHSVVHSSFPRSFYGDVFWETLLCSAAKQRLNR
jgi:hypothetical protein